MTDPTKNKAANTVKKLPDYSGELKPDLKFEDFSQEALARLAQTYGRLYLQLLNCWQRTTREKHGLDDAISSEIEVWKQQSPFESRWVCKALNIVERDAVSFMKWQQITPLGFLPGSFNYTIDVKNKNDVFITVHKCFAVDIWEREGDTAKIKEFCQTMEPAAFQAVGSAFNPKLKVIPVQLPPRKSLTEPHCRWEFKIED